MQDQQQELQLQLDSMDSEAVEAARAAAETRVVECQSAVMACKNRLDAINAGKEELNCDRATLETEMKVLC